MPWCRPSPVRRKAISSASDACASGWREEAEALGVDIFPATAAVDVVTNDKGAVTGIVTGDLGVQKDGTPGPNYAPGIVLKASYVLIAEGARGSLAKNLITRFRLDADVAPQKHSLGIKEIWEIAPDRHEPGRVDNYLGYPLPADTNGGGFAYHAEDNKLYLGFVTYLNYPNPTLSPFDEFQRFKSHPAITRLIEGCDTDLLWCPCHHCWRLAIDPETGLPWRWPDWLRCRLHERAAPQGYPQHHAVRQGVRQNASPTRWQRGGANDEPR